MRNPHPFQSYKRLVNAAYSGDTSVAKAVLEAGSPHWWQDPRTMSPLQWAVRWSHRGVFDLLMDAIPSDYPLALFSHCVCLAAQNGDSHILRRLLAHPSARKASKHSLQETLYMAAGSPRPAETIEMLILGLPVDLNFRVRDYGHTLLFLAAEGRNPELVKWLLARGADASLQLENGETVINRARDPEIRELLELSRR